MKKIGIMLFLITLVVGLVVSNIFSWGRASGDIFNFSFNFKGVKGSGNSASETRDLRDFHAIEVGGIFKVEVVAQKDFAVQVEADDNLLKLIETEVRDGVLVIKTTKKISPKRPMIVRISAPQINDLQVSGAASISVQDLKNARLNVDASGASKVKVSGESTALNVDASGASNIDAASLASETAVVDASGASRAEVNVSRELKADASGASKVTYAGAPASVIEKTSGASSVRLKTD
jgi:hypothetical protein